MPRVRVRGWAATRTCSSFSRPSAASCTPTADTSMCYIRTIRPHEERMVGARWCPKQPHTFGLVNGTPMPRCSPTDRFPGASSFYAPTPSWCCGMAHYAWLQQRLWMSSHLLAGDLLILAPTRCFHRVLQLAYQLRHLRFPRFPFRHLPAAGTAGKCMNSSGPSHVNKRCQVTLKHRVTTAVVTAERAAELKK